MNNIQYDPRKNRINIRKHHISIPELSTIFDNPYTIIDEVDEKNSTDEETRYHAYGVTSMGDYVKVWYCYRGDEIRIIGGRKIKV